MNKETFAEIETIFYSQYIYYYMYSQQNLCINTHIHIPIIILYVYISSKSVRNMLMRRGKVIKCENEGGRHK